MVSEPSLAHLHVAMTLLAGRKPIRSTLPRLPAPRVLIALASPTTPPPPGDANTFTVTDSSKIFKLYLKQTAGAGPTADPSWARLMKARAGCYVGRLDVSCTKKESADGWSSRALPARPEGPCDILGAAGTACVAAHSVVRALYANYTAALYEGPRPPGYEAMEKQGASILASGGDNSCRAVGTFIHEGGMTASYVYRRCHRRCCARQHCCCWLRHVRQARVVDL